MDFMSAFDVSDVFAVGLITAIERSIVAALYVEGTTDSEG
jgi:hypothetical protein